MSFLDRLFGKKEAAAPPIDDEPTAECPHGSLAPHWDNVADFGKHDLIAFYICSACGTKFGREEGELAMTRASEIVKVDMSVRKAVKDAADAAATEANEPAP